MRLVDNIFNSMVGKGETYTPVDYLESTATDKQWIDTGLPADENTVLNFKFYIKDFGVQTYIGYSDASINFQLYQYNRQYYVGYGTQYLRIAQNAKPENNWTEVTLGKNSRMDFYDGTSATLTFNDETFTTSGNVYLFARNSTYSNYFRDLRLSEIKRYDSGVLTQDFQPKLRNSDGVAGMHEVVNDVFYPSANGVNFLYGNF